MSRERRFGAFVIAVFPLVAVACSSSPSSPTTTTPFVTGRVLDFQTNLGVPGVPVVFGTLTGATSIDVVGQAITDGSGSYQMSVMARQYSVYVDNAYGGQAVVRAGVNRTNLFAHPNGCVVRYGTIADSSTGRPLAGAAVSLVGVTTTSGADGAYRLDLGCRTGLWSNTICIAVTRAGYQDGCVPMGRGEYLDGVILQDVDLTPR